MRGKLWVVGAVSAVALLAAIYFGVHSPPPRVESPDASARRRACRKSPVADEAPTTPAPSRLR